MYKTWKLFSEKIHFDVPEEEYELPIDLAVILGKMMLYSMKRQELIRKDGGDIELSAMIVGSFVWDIRNRKTFSRQEPVLIVSRDFKKRWLKMKYDLVTGELYVQYGLDEEDDPFFIYDFVDRTFREVERNNGDSMIVTDISRWWDIW